MWPLIGILLLGVGAIAAQKKKQQREAAGPGPLEEEPDPQGGADEAVAVATEAVDRASEAARTGDVDEAAAAAKDAADAATSAAGTDAGTIAAELAKQVEAIAKAAAANAGIKLPPVSKTSPGIPQVDEEDDEPDVVVEPEPAPDEPLPPPPKTKPKSTASFPAATLPKPIQDIADDVVEVAKSLPIPIAIPKSADDDDDPPLAKEETKPDLDPNGTIGLARRMLKREQSTGWRGAMSPEVTTWQRRVGITADGKFGPGSAGKMAEEVGVIPLIRFWPRSSPSKASALKKYRNDMATRAANLFSQGKKEHAAALNVSASFEDARAFGNANPRPVTNAERLAQVKELSEAVA